MKTYWGSRDTAPLIPNIGIRWKWVVCFTPRSLYSQERTTGTDWIWGWVGPGAGLDAVARTENPSQCQESKLQLRNP